MTTNETIAVLGAGGTMGKAMARNLAKAGYSVRAWNRSRDKADSLADDGATVLDSPTAAVEGAGVILTMLADADAVLSAIADTHVGHADDNTVWLQMSTIGEEGKLVILASGPDDLHPRLDPIFDVLGQRTVWAGDAGAGTRLKLAVNAWLLAVVEGAAETLALAEGIGLDPHVVLDAISGGPLDAPYLQMKGKTMLERSFDPQFTLKLAAKDARLAVESAQSAGLDLPMLVTIEQRFAAAVDEHGDRDLSVTFLTSAPSR